MLSVLTAYVAPAKYVIPSVLCVGLLLPLTIMFTFRALRNKDMKNPNKKTDEHHH